MLQRMPVATANVRDALEETGRLPVPTTEVPLREAIAGAEEPHPPASTPTTRPSKNWRDPRQRPLQ